jgi:WD40 repeat protein
LGSGYQGYVVKIADNGAIEWDAYYDNHIDSIVPIYGQDQQFVSIDTMPDGGYIVGGGTTDSLGNPVGFIMRIDAHGCLRTDTCEAHIHTNLASPSPEEMGVTAYPNPVSGRLYLSEVMRGYDITICDMQGRVSDISISGSEIDVSRLSSGMYCLRISNDNGTVVRRFVKE